MLVKSTAVLKTYFLGTGLTTVTLNGISKNGGAFASPHDGAVTSLGNGWYKVSLDATDTNTNGDLALHFAAVAGTPVDPPADTVYTAPVALIPNDGTPTINFKNIILSNPAGSAFQIIGNAGIYIEGTNGEGLTIISDNSNAVSLTGGVGLFIEGFNGDAISVLSDSNNAISLAGPCVGITLASNGLDAIVVEAGLNARQSLSVIAAAVAGTLSGAGTTSITIHGGGVVTTRIVATVDSSGNRSAVTLSPPA